MRFAAFLLAQTAVLCFVQLGFAQQLSPEQLALCKNPALSRLLTFCRFVDNNTPCVYTPWLAWTPVRFATSRDRTGVTCPEGKAILYNTTRTLSIGEAPRCSEPLTKEEFRCPPTTAEQIEQLQAILGGNFGNTPGAAPSAPRGPAGPKGPSGPKGVPGARKVRPKQLPPLPTVTRDIALVLDASGSVGRKTFNKMVDDLAELMGLLCYQFTRYGAASDVRIALVVYSTTVRKVFDFNFSRLRHTSLANIVDSIRSAKTFYSNGLTATGPALRYCYDNIFTSAAGMSALSRKRILLITDGFSNRGENPATVSQQLYEDKNVQVFPVGVGSNFNLPELIRIRQAGSNVNLLSSLLVLNLPSFSSLTSIVQQVRASASLSPQQCQRDLFKR